MFTKKQMLLKIIIFIEKEHFAYYATALRLMLANFFLFCSQFQYLQFGGCDFSFLVHVMAIVILLKPTLSSSMLRKTASRFYKMSRSYRFLQH